MRTSRARFKSPRKDESLASTGSNGLSLASSKSKGRQGIHAIGVYWSPSQAGTTSGGVDTLGWELYWINVCLPGLGSAGRGGRSAVSVTASCRTPLGGLRSGVRGHSALILWSTLGAFSVVSRRQRISGRVTVMMGTRIDAHVSSEISLLTRHRSILLVIDFEKEKSPVTR